MKTHNIRWKQDLDVWATPMSAHRAAKLHEEDPTALPFDFEVRVGSPWRTGAVRLHTFLDMPWVLPDGLDLLTAAIRTLREEQKTTLEEADKKVAELEEQIKIMLRLTHDPIGQDYNNGEGQTILVGEIV